MIQATASTPDGTPVLVLGFSHENLSRLVADESIKIHTEKLGLPPMVIVIGVRKTEEEFLENFREAGFIGTKTEFRLPGT